MRNHIDRLDFMRISEKTWETKFGASFPGERVVYRGKDLFEDLQTSTWMELLLLGVTGREFSKNQIKLFDALWTLSVSYPDPRLWNNRVAALAGTARSTAALASSAASAVSEAQIYGGGAIIKAFDFITKTKKDLDEGKDLDEIIKSELKTERTIRGYGRPIINSDERIKPIMKLAEKLGFSDGTHLKLAFEIEKVLSSGRWKMKMNVAALAAALSADQGLTVREYYHWCANSFLAGILPCFIDAIEHPEGAFFPLRCERISYEGVNSRSW